MDIGLLILRLVVGGLFIGHGTQKLFGWFGGGGPEGTGGFFESLGYRPGRAMAVVAGLGEAGGGLLLAIGFFTPLGSAAIIGVMLNAALAVHVANGVWNQDGGFEYPLVNATAAAALAFVGPGAASVDRAIGWELNGMFWGVGAVAVGALAGLAVHASRRPEAAEEGAEEDRRAA